MTLFTLQDLQNYLKKDDHKYKLVSLRHWSSTLPLDCKSKKINDIKQYLCDILNSTTEFKKKEEVINYLNIKIKPTKSVYVEESKENVSESNSENDSESDSKDKSESDSESENDSDSESVSESESESFSDSSSEQDSESENEAKNISDSDIESDSETESNNKSDEEEIETIEIRFKEKYKKYSNYSYESSTQNVFEYNKDFSGKYIGKLKKTESIYAPIDGYYIYNNEVRLSKSNNNAFICCISKTVYDKNGRYIGKANESKGLWNIEYI